MFIINNINQDQMILRSELGVWEIIVHDSNIIINIRTPTGNLINTETLVDFSYGIQNTLLKCNISAGNSSLRVEILDVLIGQLD